MTRTHRTDNQIRDLHAQYLKFGKSVAAFAAQQEIDYSTLWKRFRKLDLEIIPQSITRRKYPINDRFFETIDTEEKAYVLGFIFADGCNYEPNHNVVISLNKKDSDILCAISKLLLFGNISVVNEKHNKVRLSLINRKLSDDLHKLGGVARKTLVLKFPDIPTKLHHHFIRGYFDGDGMLTFHQRPGSTYKEFDFSIVSTAEMLNVIMVKIENIGIHAGITKRHKDRDNNNFTLRVSGNHHIKTVCDYLYADATICLQRKRALYLELVEYSKQFRVSDNEFIGAHNECNDVKFLATKLGIDRKTVKRRMKKLGLV